MGGTSFSLSFKGNINELMAVEEDLANFVSATSESFAVTCFTYEDEIPRLTLSLSPFFFFDFHLFSLSSFSYCLTI